MGQGIQKPEKEIDKCRSTINAETANTMAANVWSSTLLHISRKTP